MDSVPRERSIENKHEAPLKKMCTGNKIGTRRFAKRKSKTESQNEERNSAPHTKGAKKARNLLKLNYKTQVKSNAQVCGA